MSTIAEKLALLDDTKAKIKASIEAKGVAVGNAPFADYPAKIAQISGGGIFLILNRLQLSCMFIIGLHLCLLVVMMHY